jgi:hypothetical protein
MSSNVKRNSYERYQENNRDRVERSRARKTNTPDSSSQWAEVLATADRYY